MFDYTSLENYQQNLLNGITTCVNAVSFYLENIRKNSHLNAFLEVFEDEALQKAVLLDKQRLKKGEIKKLHGVIVGLKDVICYKNHRVSASSKILENFNTLYHSTAVEKLLDEEAIIIGRLNCDEFAMGSSNENSAYGIVLNPLDETRIPGGSSGGSAVAVKAKLCMVSLGSDTGGSVRQPADFCGLVGLKPSYGRVSRHGLIAYASSFDQIGIFANTVEDAAKVLNVIAGADDFDSTVITDNLPETKLNENKKNKQTVGFFPEMLDHKSIDKEIAGAYKNLLSILPEYGYTIRELNFSLLKYIVPAYYVLTTAEASSNLSRYDGIRFGRTVNESNVNEQITLTRSKFFGKEVKRRIMLGTFVLSEGYYDAYVSQAQKVRQMLINQTKKIFTEVDAVILPVSPTTAFKIGENTDPVAMFLADIFTVYANLVGVPAISIPFFTHSNSMPFGLQLITGYKNEVSLMQLASQLSSLKDELILKLATLHEDV